MGIVRESIYSHPAFTLRPRSPFGGARRVKARVETAVMRSVGPLAIAHTRYLFVLKLGVPRAALTRLIAGLGICLAPFSSTATLHAQTLSGIRGTVTDQSKLAVSDARVSVANLDTGVRRNTETNNLGSYYITDLIPGTYTVNWKLSRRSSVLPSKPSLSRICPSSLEEQFGKLTHYYVWRLGYP